MEKSTEALTNMRKAASRRNRTPQNRVRVKNPSVVSTIWLLLIVALIATLKIVAQEATQSGQVQVGARAPLFVLKDQNDHEFSLETMLKKGPVALVFVRSVQWCSYCQLQTVQLSQNLEKVQAAGGQVAIVCYDPPEKVKRFAERTKVKIPILSDSDSKMIEAYGMRARTGAGDQIGSSQHGTFVIDQSGIICSKPYLTSFEGDEAVNALANALKDANAKKSKENKS
jgi:peroxiredoxin